MRIYQKKVCVLGDFAVGKTSLIKRYIERRFDEKYLTTVGVVVSRKQLVYPEHTVNLLIWDLAGGRDFSHTGYLAGVSGGFIVCDLTRSSTLAAFREYTEQIHAISPQATLILLANKADISHERSISDEQLQAITNELDIPVLLTSAKTGEMVDQAFTLMADLLVTTRA